MRLLLRKRKIGELEFGVIYGTIALMALGAARFFPLTELAPACPFRSLLGVSCPTCGTTRSLVCASHGDIVGALALNPLMTIILLAATVSLVVNCLGVLLQSPRVVIFLSPLEKNIMSITAFLLFLANWTYLISTT